MPRIGTERLDARRARRNHGAMNITHRFPFAPVRPQTPAQVNGLPTARWSGSGRHIDGARQRAPAHSSPENGIPFDVLGMADDWMGRMAQDPANAAAIFGQYQQHVAQLAPSMERHLMALPQASSERGIQRQLHGLGERLGAQARAKGQPPTFVYSDLRGGPNDASAFRQSLDAAGRAGIQHLVVEQPPHMESIDHHAGGPALAMLRHGDVRQLKSLLRQAPGISPRTAAAFVDAAQQVHDAARAGFEVDFVDPAHGRPMSSGQRNKAMAAHLAQYHRQGLGVMVATLPLNAPDITSLVSQKGSPVAAAAFLSGGRHTPDSALALRHFQQTLALGAPNFKVVRLDHRPFGGAQPAHVRGLVDPHGARAARQHAGLQATHGRPAAPQAMPGQRRAR